MSGNRLLPPVPAQSQPGVQIRAVWGSLPPCHLAAAPLAVLQHQGHGQCDTAVPGTEASSALSAPLKALEATSVPSHNALLDQADCETTVRELFTIKKLWETMYLFIPERSYFNSINVLYCHNI